MKLIESETKISRSIQIENQNQCIKKNKHTLLYNEDVKFKDAMTVNCELDNDKNEQNFSKNSIINNNNISEDIMIENDFAH